MLIGKRKVLKLGKSSKAITVPAGLPTGSHATFVAGRLLLLDLQGDISEEKLLEFMSEHVEPAFWLWIKSKGGNEV